VGVLAGQSIGERGTQKMMKGKHTGGTAEIPAWAKEIQAKKTGTVRFQNLAHLTTRNGQLLVLAQAGKLLIVGLQGETGERYPVPYGAQLLVNDGDPVQPGTRLCQWDPYMVPILAEVAGRVRFDDLVEGETLVREVEGIQERWTVCQSRRGLHPQILLESEAGQTLASYPLPARAHLEVREGQAVEAGDRLVRVPRSAGTTQDIAGALPQLTQIFEAGPVRDAAVLAEIDGRVRLGEKQRRHWSIWVETKEAKARKVHEHRVPRGRRLRVKTGDTIRVGEPLTDGTVALTDLLRILGPDVVQSEIVERVQRIYRDQRAWVDDKHIEIIVAQMLGKVMIKSMGDTDLLPGSVMDKSALLAVNKSCMEAYVKIKEPGDSTFKTGSLVRKETFAAERSRQEAEGKQPPTSVSPQPATGRVLLLGIRQVAMLADSFLAAASFQSVPKVLMEAALAGKIDDAAGIKSSIILGQLVPLGTGSRPAALIQSTGQDQEPASVSAETPQFAGAKEEKATAGSDR
jgi:DNA-directed RNA polymerase subunit beta'